MNTSNYYLAGAMSLLLMSTSDVVEAQTKAETDPMADLADLYAWVSPDCVTVNGAGCESDPEELIVAMTLKRDATRGDRFTEDLLYHFNFEDGQGQASQISCSFTNDQVVTCAGTGTMSSLEAEANVGEVGVNGDLKVFAGLRDDPYSVDSEALVNFGTLGIAAYDGIGTDSLAGTNVMAIVLAIKTTAISGAVGNQNLLRVWGSSERIAGDGINGAISGTWFNPNQDGQGWVVEVISDGAGNPGFLSFFYGYDNDAEQAWLITGAAQIDGNTVTADAYRTTASGFGGDYDSTSFGLGEVVGTLTFEFESCNAASVSFASSNTAELADFENDLTRLSSIHSMSCALLTAGQVDRVGRPFVAGLMPADMQDEYNSNDDPASWNSAYQETLLAALNSVALADGDPAWNGFGSAEEWAQILTDDRILVDVKKAQSVDFLGIELSQLVPQDWNDSAGRALDYDVHETFFNVMITSFGPFIDDGVQGNDLPFLNSFPYLSNPH